MVTLERLIIMFVSLKPINSNRGKRKHIFLPYVGESSMVAGNFLKTLDPSSVEYSIPCSDCPSIDVNETCQLLEKRLDQHKSEVRRIR